jgi:acetate kinase
MRNYSTFYPATNRSPRRRRAELRLDVKNYPIAERKVMNQSNHGLSGFLAGSVTNSPRSGSPGPDRILTINGGSSSLKFALFERTDPSARLLSGNVDRIGLDDARWFVAYSGGGRAEDRAVHAPDQKAAAGLLIDWLEGAVGFAEIAAVGHRVVHGGSRYYQPERVTAELIDELGKLSPYDPDHLPGEIELIEAFRNRDADLPQVACFDTAFHHNMPRVAQIVPIPRRFEAAGVRRYGFHGLSYAFLMEELARVAGPDEARARVVLAHLGAGASLAAVHDGHSIDTTMGFTPASGLVMGTRTGDLDPGLVRFLSRTAGMTADQFDNLANRESGLLGVSETSSDVRDLLARQSVDVRAAEAIELFCYQAKKWIGAFAAALGGLDTLVFAGGIGENAPEIRRRICESLGFLGISLDEGRNASSASLISTDQGPVKVRVIHTDEALMIVRAVARLIPRPS